MDGDGVGDGDDDDNEEAVLARVERDDGFAEEDPAVWTDDREEAFRRELDPADRAFFGSLRGAEEEEDRELAWKRQNRLRPGATRGAGSRRSVGSASDASRRRGRPEPRLPMTRAEEAERLPGYVGDWAVEGVEVEATTVSEDVDVDVGGTVRASDVAETETDQGVDEEPGFRF